MSNTMGDFTIEHQRLEEIVVEGKRLGSHFHKDSRSKNFHIRELIAGYQTDPTKLDNRSWARHIAALNQGEVGSCTGNALTGAIATDPLYTTYGQKLDASLNEDFALNLYETATQVDGLGAPYPPNDRGSSTLGVLKAAQKLGYIDEYRWGFGLVDALNMLSLVGSIITGVLWYEGFDTPTGDGELVISGNVRGGHELEISEIDVDNRRVWGWNSWGDTWDAPEQGQFYWTWDTFDQLLTDQGEVGIGLKTV